MKAYSKNKRIITIVSFCLLFAILASSLAFAHSGRTDSSGGHRDNKNVSGLGYYHYHCGGNPPHLHTNGVCPYKSYGNNSYSGNDFYIPDVYGNTSNSVVMPNVIDFTVSDFEQTLPVGGTTTAYINYRYRYNEVDEFYWESDNPRILRIDGSYATAVSEGVCTVTFTVGDCKKAFSVTVVPTYPESVKIVNLPKNMTIAVGEGWCFCADVKPWNAWNKGVSWGTDSDWRIGTIDENGFFTARSEGIATIYVYTENGERSEVNINVIASR